MLIFPCRESKKSAQQILKQLEQLSLPLLEAIDSKLRIAITYDAALSSWQELYRLISCLDFGTGLATGCATLQSVSSAPRASQSHSARPEEASTALWRGRERCHAAWQKLYELAILPALWQRAHHQAVTIYNCSHHTRACHKQLVLS